MLLLSLLTAPALAQSECESQNAAFAQKLGGGLVSVQISPFTEEGVTLHNTSIGPSQTITLQDDPVITLSDRQTQELSPVFWPGENQSMYLGTRTEPGTLPIEVVPFKTGETWYIRETTGLVEHTHSAVFSYKSVILSTKAAKSLTQSPGCSSSSSRQAKSGVPYSVLDVDGRFIQIARMWDEEQTPLGWVPWFTEDRSQVLIVNDLMMEQLGDPEDTWGPWTPDRIEVATLCTGSPAKLAFIQAQELADRPYCYLSAQEVDYRKVPKGTQASLVLGIDPFDRSQSCESWGEKEGPASALFAPQELIVRVPAETQIRVEVRPLIEPALGSHIDPSWGPSKMTYEGTATEDGVLRIPLVTLSPGDGVVYELSVSADEMGERSLIVSRPDC